MRLNPAVVPESHRQRDRPVARSAARPPQVRVHPVGRNHFAVIGTPILQGRDYPPADLTGQKTAILGRAAAERFFPDSDALGKPVWVGVWDKGEWAEVIGIADDPRHGARESDAAAHVYVPHSRIAGERRVMLIVRGEPDPVMLAQPVRAAMADVDPQLAFHRVLTMAERMASAAGPERMMSVLISLFGGLALALSTAGIYGFTTFAVSRARLELTACRR